MSGCFTWWRQKQHSLSPASSHHTYTGISSSLLFKRLSNSGQRQLETPLSTVDSSGAVGPKAACTLGSQGPVYKALSPPPPVFLHSFVTWTLWPQSELCQVMSQLLYLIIGMSSMWDRPRQTANVGYACLLSKAIWIQLGLSEVKLCQVETLFEVDQFHISDSDLRTD